MSVDGDSRRTSPSSKAVWQGTGCPLVPGPGLFGGKLRVVASTPAAKLGELLPAGRHTAARGDQSGMSPPQADCCWSQSITSRCPAPCDPVFHRSKGPCVLDKALVAHVPLRWPGAGLLLAPRAPFLHVALQASCFSCYLAAFYSNALLFQIKFPECWGWILLIFICFKAVHGLQA